MNTVPNRSHYSKRAVRSMRPYYVSLGYVGVPSSARVVNRVLVCRGEHESDPGARRIHTSGRMVHTFFYSRPRGGLLLIAPGFSLLVSCYMPGYGASYVGKTPLAHTLHGV